MTNRLSRFEKSLAAASFIVAAALTFVSLMISPQHEITAGVLMACAQFLLLTASILHIDYKLNIYGSTSKEKNPPRDSQ